MHNQGGIPLIAILALLWHVAKQFVLSEQCNENSNDDNFVSLE